MPTSDSSAGVDSPPSSGADRVRDAVDQFVVVPAAVVWGDWRARVGAIIVGIYLLMGTVGVVLVDEPTTNEGELLQPPFQSLEFPLGTDGLGQGIFSQIVHATPAMLIMITSGAVFTIVLATAVGAFAGYKGGRVDEGLMLLTDIVMTIPGLPLIIIAAAFLNPEDPMVVGIVLSINAWAGLARSLRSEVLTLRNAEYVEASRIMGIDTRRIVVEDILPNLMPYLTMNFVQTARNIIFASVALYFLGILPSSNFNWGVMMDLSYSTAGALYTWESAHWLIAPMAAIIGLSLGLTLFAQGADRLFNPKIRARHMETSEEVANE